ncbi:MAG: hypothetical protein QM783_17115 [Phycisphaerales bacterium]
MRFERVPLVWVVFLIVPPLWATANLLGTACYYAKVEGFTAGWQNASVGVGEAYGDSGWLFREFTPCCVFIAGASMVWPRRIRWLVAGVLLVWLGWIAWNSLSAWHRHSNRDAPSVIFLLAAGVSLSLRSMYGFVVERIARFRTLGP